MARTWAWHSNGQLAVAAIGVFVVTAMLWLAVWAVVPAIVGWTPVAVVSESMAPAIRTGDVVLAQPPTGDLQVGSVVLFRDQSGQHVTHRIVEVLDDGSYRTQGDSNRSPDSTPVPPEEVEGIGRLLVPLAGLPRVWLQQGSHGLLVAWAGCTLAALWAAGVMLRPGSRSAPDPAGPLRVGAMVAGRARNGSPAPTARCADRGSRLRGDDIQ